MAEQSPKTVVEYLASLPADRRKVIAAVRRVIRKHLPAGYRESIGWGIICYSVPLSVCPDTYNGQPLGYVALGAQKNYYVLHMMLVYGDAARTKALKDAFARAGKKLDMGKACLRFKSIDDLPLEVIGETIASMPMKAYVARYREMQEAHRLTKLAGKRPASR